MIGVFLYEKISKSYLSNIFIFDTAVIDVIVTGHPVKTNILLYKTRSALSCSFSAVWRFDYRLFITTDCRSAGAVYENENGGGIGIRLYSCRRFFTDLIGGAHPISPDH